MSRGGPHRYIVLTSRDAKDGKNPLSIGPALR